MSRRWNEEEEIRYLLVQCFLTRISRQLEEKSRCAGMVESTERIRQLKTKMNLNKTQTIRVKQDDINGTNSKLLQSGTIKCDWSLHDPLRLISEVAAVLRKSRTPRACQRNNRTYFLSAMNHEPDYYPISPRYQPNHTCLCNITGGKQAVKL